MRHNTFLILAESTGLVESIALRRQVWGEVLCEPVICWPWAARVPVVLRLVCGGLEWAVFFDLWLLDLDLAIMVIGGCSELREGKEVTYEET